MNNEIKCSDLRDELQYVEQSGFNSADRQNRRALHLSVCADLLVLVCVKKRTY